MFSGFWFILGVAATLVLFALHLRWMDKIGWGPDGVGSTRDYIYQFLVLIPLAIGLIVELSL